MSITVIVIQGLFEVTGLFGFIFGFFFDISWLMIISGILLVLDDIIEIALKTLNPVFPILLAIALAIIISPWYVGVFWASAVFKIIGVPTSLKKIISPKKLCR